jgi:type II secretory pathway pseudopilin PulG
MTKHLPIRRSKPSEEGFTLLSVVFLVAMMTLALSIAMPTVIAEIQHDRELETMQRGKQYIRGVKLFYKQFRSYPPNADAMIKGTTGIRFMRKKYVDPTTGMTDWKPVFIGQNRAPLAMGFFGIPLGGLGVASNVPGASTNGIQSASSLATQSTGTDPNGPADPSNPNASTSGTAGNTSANSQTGQIMGGLGIMGFSPNSPSQSIMVYKTKTHYNEWEFVYYPLLDQMQPGANPVPSIPLQPGAPGFSGPSAPNATPTPTTPQ